MSYDMLSFKITFILFFTTILCHRLSGQQKQEHYKVDIRLNGFKENTKFYIVNLDSTGNIDSAILKNGQITLIGQIDNPTVFRLFPESENLYFNFWIENKNIKITGNKGNFSQLKIEGSPLNEIDYLVKSKHLHLDKLRDNLCQKALSESDEKKSIALWKKIDAIDLEVLHTRLQTIATFQPSLVTMQELYFLRNDLTQDSLRMLFEKFPISLKENKYGDVITEYLITKDMKSGSYYTDIFGVDTSGKEIHLSDFKGKVILLDFWASWCGPCRNANKDLTDIYNRESKNDFEIVSFSIDTDAKSWKSATENDSIRWTNISDLKGLYSKQAALYKIRAIPKSFLIDKTGKIAEVFSGYDSENGKKNLEDKIDHLLK